MLLDEFFLFLFEVCWLCIKALWWNFLQKFSGANFKSKHAEPLTQEITSALYTEKRPLSSWDMIGDTSFRVVEASWFLFVAKLSNSSMVEVFITATPFLAEPWSFLAAKTTCMPNYGHLAPLYGPEDNPVILGASLGHIHASPEDLWLGNWRDMGHPIVWSAAAGQVTSGRLTVRSVTDQTRHYNDKRFGLLNRNETKKQIAFIDQRDAPLVKIFCILHLCVGGLKRPLPPYSVVMGELDEFWQIRGGYQGSASLWYCW